MMTYEEAFKEWCKGKQLVSHVLANHKAFGAHLLARAETAEARLKALEVIECTNGG